MYVVYAYVCASFICYYCSQNERTLNLSANEYCYYETDTTDLESG